MKEKNKNGQKNKVGVIISVAAVTAAVIFVLTSYFNLRIFNGKLTNVNNLSKTYSELKEVSDCIDENYYTDADEENVKNGLLKGYVSGLDDKYSKYMTADEYSQFTDTESGNSTGIGITVSKTEDGYIKVEEIAEEGPAAKENIKVGDVIISVEGDDVSELGYEEAINRIKGEDGTKVSLSLLRKNNQIEVTALRKTYEVKSVYYQMMNENVGYIRITGFRTATINQFSDAFAELEKSGAKKFIFDVRNNGGGLLSALQEIIDPLLPEGDIATANYKGGKVETVIKSDSQYIDVPAVVLVNENTASAAELFSCSLRDFTGAKLVGTQTYGKGVMQNTYKLSSGGAVTLTVATYQTTKSECYNGVGLIPDNVVESNENDDIKSADPEKDAQLSEALSIIQNEN